MLGQRTTTTTPRIADVKAVRWPRHAVSLAESLRFLSPHRFFPADCTNVSRPVLSGNLINTHTQTRGDSTQERERRDDGEGGWRGMVREDRPIRTNIDEDEESASHKRMRRESVCPLARYTRG